MKSKHDWNWLDDYLRVHYRVLDNYSSSIETIRPYTEEWVTPEFLLLRVSFFIVTLKGNRIRIDIRKDVEVETLLAGKRKAKTEGYSYNASDPNGSLIRYCSPHDENEGGPDYHRSHHRHDFTEKPPIVVVIGKDKWPHVNEFLDEVLKRL